MFGIKIKRAYKLSSYYHIERMEELNPATYNWAIKINFIESFVFQINKIGGVDQLAAIMLALQNSNDVTSCMAL